MSQPVKTTRLADAILNSGLVKDARVSESQPADERKVFSERQRGRKSSLKLFEQSTAMATQRAKSSIKSSVEGVMLDRRSNQPLPKLKPEGPMHTYSESVSDVSFLHDPPKKLVIPEVSNEEVLGTFRSEEPITFPQVVIGAQTIGKPQLASRANYEQLSNLLHSLTADINSNLELPKDERIRQEKDAYDTVMAELVRQAYFECTPKGALLQEMRMFMMDAADEIPLLQKKMQKQKELADSTIAALSSENQQLAESNKTLTERNGYLEKTYKELITRMQFLESKIPTIEEDNRDLRIQVKNADKELKRVRDELSEVKMERDKLRKDLELKAQMVEDVGIELQKALDALRNKEQSENDLLDQLERLKRQLKLLEMENDKLHNDMKEMLAQKEEELQAALRKAEKAKGRKKGSGNGDDSDESGAGRNGMYGEDGEGANKGSGVNGEGEDDDDEMKNKDGADGRSAGMDGEMDEYDEYGNRIGGRADGQEDDDDENGHRHGEHGSDSEYEYEYELDENGNRIRKRKKKRAGRGEGDGDESGENQKGGYGRDGNGDEDGLTLGQYRSRLIDKQSQTKEYLKQGKDKTKSRGAGNKSNISLKDLHGGKDDMKTLEEFLAAKGITPEEFAKIRELILKSAGLDGKGGGASRDGSRNSNQNLLGKGRGRTALSNVETQTITFVRQRIDVATMIRPTELAIEKYSDAFTKLLDPMYSNRTPKPFEWILKSLRSIYDEKTLKDTVDEQEGRNLCPMPQFALQWSTRQYGLSYLSHQCSWDLVNSARAHQEKIPEIEMFRKFLDEDYSSEQLTFFLRVRANCLRRGITVAMKTRDGDTYNDVILSGGQALDLMKRVFEKAGPDFIDIAWRRLRESFMKRPSPNLDPGVPYVSMSSILNQAVDAFGKYEATELRKMMNQFQLTPKPEGREFHAIMKELVSTLSEEDIAEFHRLMNTPQEDKRMVSRRKFKKIFRARSLLNKDTGAEILLAKNMGKSTKDLEHAREEWIQLQPILDSALETGEALEKNVTLSHAMQCLRVEMDNVSASLTCYDVIGVQKHMLACVMTYQTLMWTIKEPRPDVMDKLTNQIRNLIHI